MSLDFLDRDDERRRIRRFLGADSGQLAVVYGRRRCGKSTLLQRICSDTDIYSLADERESALQIQSLAAEVARVVPAFDQAHYPTWDALFTSLNARAERLNLILDEFPYLVAAAPELPSILQRYIDRPSPKRLRFLLCGSSQRMMQGLALDRTAPLYGRAQEILKVTPLRPGWIVDALKLSGPEAVEAWAVWGGVPRYWELASRYPNLGDAIRDLVLHRHGVLHEEVHGLLLDDMRTASQAASLLAVIASGSHRLSEIGARLAKPAGALTRPLANLIDLGYVQKEIPFEESERSTKRTLYRVADPFVSFWHRFVLPMRSLLHRDLITPAENNLAETFPKHCAEAWEHLARESVPFLKVGGVTWGPAQRWWGPAAQSQQEFDIVAESLDGKSVLIGEAKWANKPDIARWRVELQQRAAKAPFIRGRQVVHALWVKNGANDADTIGPDAVLAALR